jgi:hypothetical protein
MAPGMNAYLVTGKILSLQNSGRGNGSRTHDEHGRADVDLIQRIEESRGIRARAIIICATPAVLRGASSDISRACATTTSPPANGWVGCRSGVSWASTSNVNCDVRDCNTGLLDLLDPLLDLRRIRRRRFVERRIVSRGQLRNWRCEERSGAS